MGRYTRISANFSTYYHPFFNTTDTVICRICNRKMMQELEKASTVLNIIRRQRFGLVVREKHKVRELTLRSIDPTVRDIKLSGAGQAGGGCYCDSSVSISFDRSNGEMAVVEVSAGNITRHKT